MIETDVSYKTLQQIKAIDQLTEDELIVTSKPSTKDSKVKKLRSISMDKPGVKKKVSMLDDPVDVVRPVKSRLIKKKSTLIRRT